MSSLLINRLLFADAPPCVAFKHNPCHYTSAESIGIYFVLAAIIIVCAILLGLLTTRRRRRAKRARRAGSGSKGPT
ncbi:MAG: hypothetical protein ACLP8S_22330 [Solirubrobacteraceae bacterium]